MIALFTTVENINTYHPLSKFTNKDSDQVLDIYTRSIYGGISGAIAAFLTVPIDNVRTTLILNPNTNAMNVIKDIAAKRSIKPFFKGAAARSIWWFSVCAMFFPLYEKLQTSLD